MTFVELAERCEQARCADRELDATIHAFIDGYTAIEERRGGWIVAVGKGVMERSLGLIDPGKHSRNFTPQHHDTPAYTGSLDAAMKLVPEGWRLIRMERRRGDEPIEITLIEWPGEGYVHNRAGHTWSLAICAAALKARAASVDTHPQGGDVKQAPFMGSAVPERQTPEPGSRGPDNG